jgi:hypothetical protein
VKRFGEEMTRHTPEENLLKCSAALTETKPFENISNPLDNNSLLVYDLPTHSELEKEAALNQLNKEIAAIIKKPMLKLDNLEKKELQTNSIKIDLDIDLYQMEKY